MTQETLVFLMLESVVEILLICQKQALKIGFPAITSGTMGNEIVLAWLSWVH